MVNYTNDAIGRLTAENGGTQIATFTYDPVGNPTFKQQFGEAPRTMIYDGASRLGTMVFASATTTFTYDPNGNMSTERQGVVVTAFVYDKENRLTKMTNPDGSISAYTYGTNGLRSSRQEPGTAVSTVIWDGSDYLGEL